MECDDEELFGCGLEKRQLRLSFLDTCVVWAWWAGFEV